MCRWNQFAVLVEAFTSYIDFSSQVCVITFSSAHSELFYNRIRNLLHCCRVCAGNVLQVDEGEDEGQGLRSSTVISLPPQLAGPPLFSIPTSNIITITHPTVKCHHFLRMHYKLPSVTHVPIFNR